MDEMGVQPEAWERQSRESLKAFEAFSLYRDLGVADRSVREVARRLNKSVTLIGRWSSRHRWVERVEAWEAERDRVRRQENLAALGEMARRQARLGVALQSKAVEALTQVEVNALLESPTLVVSMAKTGAEVERRARFGVIEADARERESQAPRDVRFIFTDAEPSDDEGDLLEEMDGDELPVA